MKTDSMQTFFYGLYMDAELLRSLGAQPDVPRVARLDDYKLDLHGAAKVVESPGEVVWGTLMLLTGSELDALYSGPATARYRPMRAVATTIRGERVVCLCYNQPVGAEADLNREYLSKLIGVAEKVGLPEGYVGALRALAG